MTTSLSFASVVIWTGVVAAFFLAGLVALNPAHVVEASLGTVPLDAIGLGRLGKLTLGIRVRPVNAALLLLITVVAGIVAAFSARNLPGQHRTTRFSLLQIVVVSSLSLCVTAASLPLLALGWTIAGLAVAALVEHSDTKPAREAASLVRARMLLGDVAIWIACICLGVAVGSLDIVDLFEFSVSAAARDSTLMTVSAFLILLGGGIRSTLVPFHDWLPETAEAPTPVSALLHAGIVNGIGVLGLLLLPVFRAVPIANYVLLGFGVLTALAGTAQTRVRADVKGRLAASTTSQMGYLAVQVSLGLPAAAITHLVGHGLWKAGLFLQAGGAVERVRGAADHPIREVSGWRWIFAGVVAGVVVSGVVVGLGLWEGQMQVRGAYELVPLIVAWFTGTCALVATTTISARLVIGLLLATYLLGVHLLDSMVVGYLVDNDRSGSQFVPQELAVVGILVLIGITAVILDRKMRHGGVPWLAGMVALSSMPRMGLFFALFRPRLSVPSALRRIGKPKAITAAASNGNTTTNNQRQNQHTATSLKSFDQDLKEAFKHIAPLWPLASFVASNPLAGLEDHSFREAIGLAKFTWGCKTGPDAHVVRKAVDENRIGLGDVQRELGKETMLNDSGPQEVVVQGITYTRTEFLQRLVMGGLAVTPGSDKQIGKLLDTCAKMGYPLSSFQLPLSARTPLGILASMHDQLKPYDDLARTFGTLLCSRVLGDPAWPAGGLSNGFAEGLWDAFRFRAATGGVDAAICIDGAGEMICKLPADPSEALEQLLEELGITYLDRVTLMTRYLTREPGWPAHVAWRMRQGIDAKGGLVEVLAVRVALETAVILAFQAQQQLKARKNGEDTEAGQPLLSSVTEIDLEDDEPTMRQEATELLLQACEALGLDPKSLKVADVVTLLNFCTTVDFVAVGQVRFRLLEEAFRGKLVSGIHKHLGKTASPQNPEVQIVTCIDVRSERLRRQLERTGGPWETMGAAGFFGLPLRHVGPQGACSDRCPALLVPSREVVESVSDEPIEAPNKELAIEEIETKAVAPFAYAEAAGWVTGPLSLLRTILPRFWFRLFGHKSHQGEMFMEVDKKPDAVAIGIAEDGVLKRLPGFTFDELVASTEGILRTTGFRTGNFAPLVVLCGHGAAAPNNPHVAAYDCGACGGFPGDVSSRAVCIALNSPLVRAGLKAKGVDIPETTHFTPSIHDTTRDKVHFLAEDEVPFSHKSILARFTKDLETACDRTLAERFSLLPGAPKTDSIATMRAHVEVRAVDWAQPRPEWGLGSNGSMVIGPRHLTSKLDLQGRVFMQSYDPSNDPTLSSLTFLMTAPLVVGHWISSQYLFSTVDPERFGAGDKTTHDVVASHDGTPSVLTGVLTGVRGDLRIGLPWQGLSTSAPLNGKWVGPTFHEPIRLFGVIYAKRESIDKVLSEQESIRKLVEGDWVAICSIDPETGAMMRRLPKGGWEPERAAN